MEPREFLMHLDRKIDAIARRMDHLENMQRVIIDRDIRLKDAIERLKRDL
jgi:hypothetical protein